MYIWIHDKYSCTSLKQRLWQRKIVSIWENYFFESGCFLFLSTVFFFFSIFFFSLFVFVVTVDPAGHAAWINISIYILSLSPEFYFAKGISKALDLHTGHAYDQKKKNISCVSVLFDIMTNNIQYTTDHLVPDLGSGGLGLAICEHHNITICVLNLKTREKVWVYHKSS